MKALGYGNGSGSKFFYIHGEVNFREKHEGSLERGVPRRVHALDCLEEVGLVVPRGRCLWRESLEREEFFGIVEVVI